MDDRLYRSTTDRLFTGLCGGLADHFDVAPGLVRLLCHPASGRLGLRSTGAHLRARHRVRP
ncbi:MAG: PspC domain-containing protein [Candidatus Limnocylindrales bacterium]